MLKILLAPQVLRYCNTNRVGREGFHACPAILADTAEAWKFYYCGEPLIACFKLG
jgi:hypothetical protein